MLTTLDLAHANNQIPLDKESQKLVVINTSKGLYKYKRLPFGIASAPAIFQRTLENLLQNIPNISVDLDDILITGKSREEHTHNLEKVLNRLQNAGVRLKLSKCKFMSKCIDYLGHRISEQGLQPSDKKIKAIHSAPAPQNISQLKSFLGSLIRWQWGKSQQQAFEEARQQLVSDHLLAHFDPSKPLILACDASPYGLGDVISHQFGWHRKTCRLCISFTCSS